MTPTQSTQNDGNPKPIQRLSVFSFLIKFLEKKKQYRTPVIIILLICYPASLIVFYLCWFMGMPFLVEWANGANIVWLSWIPAAFGIFLLAFIPIWVFMGLNWLFSKVVGISINEEDHEVKKSMDRVLSEEEKLLNTVEKEDKSGLIPLIKYSRLQLEAYYKIGLSQTRKSFRYSVIAMWIGFIFLIMGFSTFYLPMEKLGLSRPENINTALIAVGAIIEFISALFLWVYRSSTSQLTYFYNRQMYTHSVVLCYKIAESMTNGADEAKQKIVEKVLEKTWTVDRPAPSNSKGIKDLMTPKA